MYSQDINDNNIIEQYLFNKTYENECLLHTIHIELLLYPSFFVLYKPYFPEKWIFNIQKHSSFPSHFYKSIYKHDILKNMLVQYVFNKKSVLDESSILYRFQSYDFLCLILQLYCIRPDNIILYFLIDLLYLNTSVLIPSYIYEWLSSKVKNNKDILEYFTILQLKRINSLYNIICIDKYICKTIIEYIIF